MALANTNISVTLVKTELSSSDTSVNDLCQDSSINKWSRFKPVKFSSSWGVGSCGLEVTVGSFNGTTLSNQWDYVARVGGVPPANTGFRLGQFKKYKHLAVDPMGTTNYQSSSTSDFAYFYPPADFDDVDSFEVSIAGVISQLSPSWTGAWYFGVRMRSNNSTYIYAVAPENLNPASTPILSSGVSFNFSNTRFNSLPSTGTYEYQAFITDTYDTAFSSSNLRLQSELTTTQQSYRMLTLPLSTGTFTRTAPPTITSFSGTIGQNNPAVACTLATNTTYYHTGAGTYPTVGDSVYTDAAATIGLSQAKYSRGIGYFQIQAGGTVVDAVGIC